MLFRGMGQRANQPDDIDHKERLALLQRRVLEKIDDYEAYRFTKFESRALNTFFDLAQETGDIYDLLALCVVVPKVFFERDATLYLLDEENRMERFCCSRRGCSEALREPADHLPRFDDPAEHDGSYYIPIRGNRLLLGHLPYQPESDSIGLLAIRPGKDLSRHERLFFEKYTNRIGFQIHSRIISNKNVEHLNFIKLLVDDIGHNVIVPNMYFKLFYRRLESKIKVLAEINEEFANVSGHCGSDTNGKGICIDEEACRKLQNEMGYTYESLLDQFKEIYRHYEQTSLFLETLLRRSHFEQGRYVLETKPVEALTQILEPQLERYRQRLAERGVAAELDPDCTACAEDIEADRTLTVHVDIGLMSQVVANFFSNAIKYARPVTDEHGAERAFVRYGWKRLPGHFASDQQDDRQNDRQNDQSARSTDGLLLWFTSSGQTIPEDEREGLYSEGYRASNAAEEYGTGHGLSFIREVVHLHGGEVGYAPHPLGNTFSITLPAG